MKTILKMKAMKRLLVCLLVLCLLCGSACAEGRPPLVWGGSLFDTTFFKDNGIKLTSTSDSFSDGVTQMNSRKAPDVYGFYSGNEDLAAMVDAGLLADLSGSDIIREWTARLRPDIRDYVTDESGHIYALPDSGHLSPVYWRKDAWDAAGYAESEVPQSYVELLDFVDGWLERIAKQPSQTVCFTQTKFGDTGVAKCNYMYWLLDVLVSSWEMQAYDAGEKLNFDTPEFIALLERTRDVGLRLYKTEPHYKKRQKMLPLFENGVNGVGYFSAGRDWGLSRAVPFRITADQPKLMRANVCMSVIRADSPWRDELMASFEEMLSHYTPGDGRNADLYVDTQPGPYGVYAGSDETAVVTAGYLADWLAYDGAICLAPSRAFYLYEGKLLKFMKGELSAQKLAAIISVPKTNPNK